ncbi:hypothetical protein CLAFUW4_08810 [Fulvia fulva]|uniref:Uncharacterized protein n=1 Tax=Passalora fulva TaxID=5499 RepID=A0A9Q8PGR2_PASFU|nr:uncharacterized protein CLAFUR5_08917 [Fulvia fulva]KAK4614066.1 hypothetical protein CLAFUR4_08816 [Fulvia fulva]KAK4615104.1 hypothetical protein CLAFUR0_08808 [Fulvia fulva]UJO22114.1 hypothetical protein CLAFUR5_08917 [Fulvia fulva]WPV20500.1 hypothetical protein CLAFUW4_08810 [Fulvia fulva]WPV35342.1 hypothetical protein CLAFUW7_08811 [Fulvia fulva]
MAVIGKDGRVINVGRFTSLLEHNQTITNPALVYIFGAVQSSPGKQQHRGFDVIRFTAAGIQAYFGKTKRKMMLGESKEDWENV